MAATIPSIRPLCCWKSILRKPKAQSTIIQRCLSTQYRTPPPYPLPPGVSPTAIIAPKRMRTYPPPPSTRAHCPEPLVTFTKSQLSILDPTASRSQLFARTNPEAAHVGDILLIRFRSGDPFSGICMNIRRRGVDTACLLRNHLTRVGTEMWIKIFSPKVVGIEVVQRAEKRPRRARLYYLRKPKHDRGNLQGIVDNYLRQRTLLGSGDAKGRVGVNIPGKKKKGKK